MVEDWEEERLAYYESPEWKARAAECKQRYGHRCAVCNAHDYDERLHAHHRTYERFKEELPEDLTALCGRCHELFSKHGVMCK